MKKYILIAFMAFVAGAASGQKLQKKTDKITGDITISAKEQVLSNPLILPGHCLAGNIERGKNYWRYIFI